MPVLKAWVNPLKCPGIDLEPRVRQMPTAEQILGYLTAPGVERGLPALVARYGEVANVPDPLPIAPAEERLLEKLVWPLRHAKGSYALGNYLSCIALCGMVGEMVAILLWDISKTTLKGKVLDDAAQRALLGSSFEKLGQERRTQVLRVLDLIDDKAKDAFDSLREIRRRYLHLLSQSHSALVADARRAFEQALVVVAMALGQSYQDGGVVLRQDLMSYLLERGVAEAGEAPPSA